MAAFREASRDWLLARTVAIYGALDEESPEGEEDPIPELLGSGVLLRIAGVGFLLSAAHVMSVAAEPGVKLYVSPVESGAQVIPLHGVEVQHTVDQTNVDLAFVRLPREIDEALRPHREFLRLSDLDRETGPLRDGWFAVGGFTGALTRQGVAPIQSDVLYYGTTPYRGELTEKAEGLTIALSLPPDDPMGFDGKPTVLPDLSGISGCGMWQLLERNGLRCWRLENIRLVGITLAEVKAGGTRIAIQGCRVEHVVACIWRAYPDLRPSIAVSIPWKPRLVLPAR